LTEGDFRSSATGSIAWASRYADVPAQAYKVSKAALNMLTVQYALQFADQGFIFVPMCPGVSKYAAESL